jgi:hypothetical protein|tara:strand:+ start:1991 stop:2638 length:648 start_codon:yes stop_codon:yes gene_type:complete
MAGKKKKTEIVGDALKAIKEELARFKNRDPEKAITRTGEKSKGLIIGKDGKVTHALGPGHVDIQSNINEVRGGKKGLAAGLVLGGGAGAGGTYLAMKDSGKDSDKKKRTQADRKKSRTGKLTSAQQKKRDEAEAKKEFQTAKDKAFIKARNAGKETFMFRGNKYNTDIKTDVPGKVSRVVNKASGGMIQAAKTITKKKTASRNKTSATKWETKWG